jgi:hypothetical protein
MTHCLVAIINMTIADEDLHNARRRWKKTRR